MISEEELRKLLDQNSATHLRLQAEIVVLRRFVAQLFANASPQPLDRVEIFRLMEQAGDQLEQRFLEDLEAKMPGTTARIDQHRPPVDSSEDILPPTW